MVQSSKKKTSQNKNLPSKTLVTCVQCSNCGDIIYSRARHDYHSCSCEGVMIDGGFNYVRTGHNDRICSEPKVFKKFVKGVTRRDLYDDWNYRTNKYGAIKPNNRILTGVFKKVTLWAFGKEFIISNKKLILRKDYVVHNFGNVVKVKTPIEGRKDFKIPLCNKYVTIVTDLIIDYEFGKAI